MIILGIGGGFDLAYQNKYMFPVMAAHDAAAVLIKDGEIVAAIEEERLNRIKHTNKFPLSAIRYCIESAEINLADIDYIAVYRDEAAINLGLKHRLLNDALWQHSQCDIRSLIQSLLKEQFNYNIDSEKICFIDHHRSHAMSTYGMSTFNESLILTIDGVGDGISGTVSIGSDNNITLLKKYDQTQSLGMYYWEIIKYLGYTVFDEYKVMGLASYGDSEKYSRYFKRFYTLLPDGDYKIHMNLIPYLGEIITPRRKGMPFEQVHKDIAASLQRSIEDIVFHIVSHYKELTGITRLCMAGGVAQNCTLNGKLLYSSLFEDIFVQPASHDAGAVLGASLQVYYDKMINSSRIKLEHLYWGTSINSNDINNNLESEFEAWKLFVSYKVANDISKEAANLLAQGNVIGWIQGRSEFGPRALGNRSILADPCPSENKQRINSMVKKREDYRPFAPSVLQEYASEYFDLPINKSSFPFMIFVLNVKSHARSLLGATTHVDGTARVQTVSKLHNKKYWDLIHDFYQLTGVPMLLNTSFNNNCEPIVDSVHDAIVAYLTTDIDYLVIDNYLLSKKEPTSEDYMSLIPSLPLHVVIEKSRNFVTLKQQKTNYQIRTNYSESPSISISAILFSVLSEVNGFNSIGNLFNELQIDEKTQGKVMMELMELWQMRLIILSAAKG